MIFSLKEMLGVLDLRSIGYIPSSYYRFEPAYVLSKELKNFVNTLKREIKESVTNWLISKKYIDLERLHLSNVEKKE